MLEYSRTNTNIRANAVLTTLMAIVTVSRVVSWPSELGDIAGGDVVVVSMVSLQSSACLR